MRAELLLLLSSPFVDASRRVRKRDICSVESLNDPLVDDVPSIADALKKCGDTGRVVLPVNQTFNIRSSLDLSSCLRCDFQINGLVNISPDWDYWEKQSAVFKISNATAAIIGSDGDTGIINANGFGWAGEAALLEKIPKLFSIADESYQVYIRNLKIKNVPGTAFYIGSNSSAARFYGVDIEDAATTGYLIEQAKHIYLWNNTVRATGACVEVRPNATNIQVEESTCIVSETSKSAASGIDFRLLSESSLDWIRSIFIKKLKAIGSMNVISFRAGHLGTGSHTVEITNATFTDVTIEGPAKQAVYLEQDKTIITATGVTFSDFKGEVQKESELKCANEGDVCEFNTADWNLVTKS